MNSDRTLTVCPVCRVVTEYYLNTEISCVHCSATFTIPENSNISGSLSDIVASEESDQQEETQVKFEGLELHYLSEDGNPRESQMPSGIKKRKKFKRLNDLVISEGKESIDDEVARDKHRNSEYEKLDEPVICKENRNASEVKEMLDNSGNSLSERTMNEFKLVMMEEIRKQVLNTLAESMGDIQVVRIEEINPCTSNDLHAEINQKYCAKIKLMTTLSVPITLQRSEDDEVEKKDRDECVARKETDNHVMMHLEQQQQILKHVTCDDELAGSLNSEEVPETWFYDFGCLRSEKMFVSGQVWVSYNHRDGMPRDFLQIKKVVNVNPFRVQVTLLKPINKISTESPSTCGCYRADDKLRMVSDVLCFSHMVMCVSPRGTIGIYPVKGQVWALYKNRETNLSGAINYEIVEVSRVMNHNISLIPLLKYRRYRTVFLEQSAMEFQVSKKNELIRFSHEIPAYKLIGTIGLEGCFELDPAAIPSHLIDDDLGEML